MPLVGTLSVLPVPQARALVFISVALLLASLGCGERGGDSTSGADTSAQIAALESFITDTAQVICGWEFRCCSLPEIDAIGRSSFLTEPECRLSTARLLVERTSGIRFAIEQGRASFSPDLGTACVGALAMSACASAHGTRIAGASPVWQQFDRCIFPTVGKVAPSSACSSSLECEPGSTCRPQGTWLLDPAIPAAGVRLPPTMGDSGSVSAGHCRVDGNEGQPCSFTYECAAGLYCRGTDFVCAHPAAEGQACIAPLDITGAPVATIVACRNQAQQLLCVSDVCRRFPREGEPCLPRTFEMPLCDPSPELGLSCVGHELDGNGICRRAAQQGDACSGGPGLPPCAASLACELSPDGLLGTCQAAPAAGLRCSAEGRCAAAAACYGGRFTCVLPPPVRDGSSCASDFDCASLRCLPAVPTVDGVGSGVCVGTALPVVCAGPGAFVAPGGNPPAPADGNR